MACRKEVEIGLLLKKKLIPKFYCGEIAGSLLEGPMLTALVNT